MQLLLHSYYYYYDDDDDNDADADDDDALLQSFCHKRWIWGQKGAWTACQPNRHCITTHCQMLYVNRTGYFHNAFWSLKALYRAYIYT